MPLTLSPVLLSELEAVHRARLTWTADAPVERFLFPNGASDTSVAAFADHDRRSMNDPQSTSRAIIVKDADTGEIVSYALWMFFTKNEGDTEGGGSSDLPSDVNKGPAEALFAEGKKKRQELMEGKPHACMFSAVNFPSTQGSHCVILLHALVG